MSNQNMFVKIAIDNWQSQVNAFNSMLDKLSDEQLLEEIAPSKNRGIYLLGHLIAVHDRMLPLLRFEDAKYPGLKPLFIDAPDKTIQDIPATSQLRAQWKEVNEKLSAHYKTLSPDQWLERHASVSPEDFEKEPNRNRLNVLVGRTNHLSYHGGQLALLVKKN